MPRNAGRFAALTVFFILMGAGLGFLLARFPGPGRPPATGIGRSTCKACCSGC